MIEKQQHKFASLKMFFHRYLASLKYFFISAIIIQLTFGLWDVAFFSLNGYMVDNVIPQGKDADLLTFSIYLAIAIFIISFVFINLNFMIRGRLYQKLMYRIREDVFGHLQILSISYHDQNTVGNLLARLTTDAKTYSLIAAWPLPGLGYQINFIFGAMIYMLYLNWKIALIAFSMLPFTLVLIIIFQRRVLAASREIMSYNSKLTTAYN